MFVCEFIARNLPVEEERYYLAKVSNDDAIAHQEPNRLAASSTGWLLKEARSCVANHEGFLPDADFDDNLRTPLVVIVGDAKAAAQAVEFEISIQARLSGSNSLATQSYTFAMSGAPLSQYVVWAKMDRREIVLSGSRKDMVESNVR